MIYLKSNWMTNLWKIVSTPNFVVPFASILFVLFILLNVLCKLREKEFMNNVHKHLRVFIYLVLIYVLFVLILTGTVKRDSATHVFVFIIYTQLCGAIVLSCLFLFDTILLSSEVRTVLIGIPVGFFGILAGFFSCAYLPHLIFPKTEFGSGHLPGEFFGIDLLFLMAFFFFIIGRSLLKKIRSGK